MNKFDVGDMVIINNDLQKIDNKLRRSGIKSLGLDGNDDMESMAGKFAVIKKCIHRQGYGCDDTIYRLDIDCGFYGWVADFLSEAPKLDTAEDSEIDSLLGIR